MTNRVSFSFSPQSIEENFNMNNEFKLSDDDLTPNFEFDFNRFYEENSKLNENRQNEFNYKVSIQNFENQKRAFDGNFDSLSNSFSLFSIQQKSKLNEIQRMTEEFEFELKQLNRQLEQIENRKSEIQNEFNAIENSQNTFNNSIDIIKRSSYNTLTLNSQIFAQNNLNEDIANYTQKNNELSKQIEKLNENLNELNFESTNHQTEIINFQEKKQKLIQKIKLIKNKRFSKQNSMIEKLEDSITTTKAQILKQKNKNNSLRVTEQLLSQKLLSLNEKELALNEETKLLNKLSKKLINLKENIKLTKSVQTEINQPLNLVYDEIYDNIQKELQDELNLKQKLDDLNQKYVFYPINNMPYPNSEILHKYEKRIKRVENELIQIEEEITKKKNEKITLINEMRLVKSQTKHLVFQNNKLAAHRNGEFDLAFRTICESPTVREFKELKMTIGQKRKEIDERKQQLANKAQHLEFIMKNYLPPK